MDATKKAADLLLDMRRTTQTVAAIDEAFRPKTVQEGYDIQHLLIEQMATQFESEIVGYKVGCTSQHAQSVLHVDAPFYGRLFAHSMLMSGETLSAESYTHRVIEPEISLRLGQDVPALDGGYSAETILPYLSDMLPAIEIVSPSYDDFRTVGAPSLIADNAVHGACALGDPIPNWQQLDLANLAVTLTINEQTVHTGNSERALGSPLNVIAWLANILLAHGSQLKAGQLVITGVVTDVYSAEAGDHLHVSFGDSAEIELTFC